MAASDISRQQVFRAPFFQILTDLDKIWLRFVVAWNTLVGSIILFSVGACAAPDETFNHRRRHYAVIGAAISVGASWCN